MAFSTYQEFGEFNADQLARLPEFTGGGSMVVASELGRWRADEPKNWPPVKLNDGGIDVEFDAVNDYLHSLQVSDAAADFLIPTDDYRIQRINFMIDEAKRGGPGLEGRWHFDREYEEPGARILFLPLGLGLDFAIGEHLGSLPFGSVCLFSRYIQRLIRDKKMSIETAEAGTAIGFDGASVHRGQLNMTGGLLVRNAVRISAAPKKTIGRYNAVSDDNQFSLV